MTDEVLPDTALCFCRSMRRASNRLVDIYTVGLASCGLKPLEFALLAEIKSREKPTLAALADLFQFDRYTLRYRLTRLQKAGLVEILPDARDARNRRASLTARGRVRLDAAMPLWREAQNSVERAIGVEQAATLRSHANALAATPIAEAVSD